MQFIIGEKCPKIKKVFRTGKKFFLGEMWFVIYAFAFQIEYLSRKEKQNFIYQAKKYVEKISKIFKISNFKSSNES